MMLILFKLHVGDSDPELLSERWQEICRRRGVRMVCKLASMSEFEAQFRVQDAAVEALRQEGEVEVIE